MQEEHVSIPIPVEIQNEFLEEMFSILGEKDGFRQLKLDAD